MDDVTFSVTPYSGYENDVLRLRNSNRTKPQTLDYLNWRYLHEPSPHPPIIFWAYCDGACVGMASIIFRPYWIIGTLHYAAILGDISVNENMRGKGIGRNLLQHITAHIKKHSYHCSFVIPNEPIKKSLLAEGWIIPESFVWYVWTVDPHLKIKKYVKVEFIATLLDKLYRVINWIKLKKINTSHFSSFRSDFFDDSFESFWQEFPKTQLIIRDRGLTSLQWRYQHHPNIKYKIMKFEYEEKFIGYIIYEYESNNTCYITDILTLDRKFIKQITKLFIHEISQSGYIQSIRYKLNEGHPYGVVLEEMGFRRRKESDVFQALFSSPSPLSERHIWYVSRGDKDT
ncbi:MAG TPA: GNAT family N-acetyltransferase [Acidobacteriota bacterium]|nr:GNAT family N-acetyltransferase [Acidobacteriota bacterium]